MRLSVILVPVLVSACIVKSSTSTTGTTGSATAGAATGASDGGTDGGTTGATDGATTTGATCVATETPYDGTDNDCDPATKDDDLDGDGFDHSADCDDDDAAVHATTTFYVDADHDGVATAVTAEVCALTAPLGYLAAAGTDCDDLVGDVQVAQTFYIDADHDGVGTAVTAEVCAPTPPVGYVAAAGNDCDDLAADVQVPQTYYVDADEDGVGTAVSAQVCAGAPPAGYVASAGADCDDDDPNGQVDIVYYVDADGDSDGTASSAALCAASAPVGYAATSGPDCDDANPFVSKKRTELADDGLDNDCDGTSLLIAGDDGVFVDADVTTCATATGTRALPYCDLQQAIDVAAVRTAGHRHVFVANASVAYGTTPLATQSLHHYGAISVHSGVLVFGGYDHAWAFNLANNRATIGLASLAPTAASIVGYRPRVWLEGSTPVAIRGFQIIAGDDASNTTDLVAAVSTNSGTVYTIADCVLTAGDANRAYTLHGGDSSKGFLLRSQVTGASSTNPGSLHAVHLFGELVVWNSDIDAGDAPTAHTGQRNALFTSRRLVVVASRINQQQPGVNAKYTYGMWLQGGATAPRPVLIGNVISAGKGSTEATGLRLQGQGGVLVDNLLQFDTHASSKAIYAFEDGTKPLMTVRHNGFDCQGAQQTLLSLSMTGSTAVNYKHGQIAQVNACTTTTNEGCVDLAGNVEGAFALASPGHIAADNACHSAGEDPVAFDATGFSRYDLDGEARPQGTWDCGSDEIAD